MSPKLAERLADGGDAAQGLAGERREVATLFTDMADFTGLAESIDPPFLTRLLNEYLTGMTDIVFLPRDRLRHRCPARAAHTPRSGSFRAAQQQIPDRSAAFAAEVGMRPDDHLASFHLKRLLKRETGTRLAIG